MEDARSRFGIPVSVSTRNTSRICSNGSIASTPLVLVNGEARVSDWRSRGRSSNRTGGIYGQRASRGREASSASISLWPHERGATHEGSNHDNDQGGSSYNDQGGSSYNHNKDTYNDNFYNKDTYNDKDTCYNQTSHHNSPCHESTPMCPNPIPILPM